MPKKNQAQALYGLATANATETLVVGTLRNNTLVPATQLVALLHKAPSDAYVTMVKLSDGSYSWGTTAYPSGLDIVQSAGVCVNPAALNGPTDKEVLLGALAAVIVLAFMALMFSLT
ncbi:hypothetical protein Aph02nite_26760 [Actinoplanes philippinensis]|uniref:Uncharacterized protein n=1 Tax=Actinoplanes philippinensis TaxID=35752 RepID=A0A1I2GAB7_9ACTN|nr:hypothetical protein [Actinoplanes philippinensis]GIE76726.1 hypothetical protein Aph02nite_26760 [Actinoplanes philippinensis]SFF13930.1 hypothetical protein SAMN05421541_106332 [Actinoplanes philippinensis]